LVLIASGFFNLDSDALNAALHAATGKLFALGAEFVLVSLPIGLLIVYAAEWLAAAFRRSKWIERALNYSFAAIFTAFAATILTAQARH
jgi:threonine/homoserine/homoserine lactone efflux protein